MDIEQQQQHHDTSVVPPTHSGAGAQYSSQTDKQQRAQRPSSPQRIQNRFGWVKTPKGILRLVEWMCSVVMFATMADVGGFDYYSEFRYQVACGVLVWLYVMTLIIVYIFRDNVERHCLYLPVIELAFDGIFCIMLLAAGAATAAQCNKNQGFGFKLCDVGGRVGDNLKASIVFSFFLLVCFIASTFFSWRDNAAEERKR